MAYQSPFILFDQWLSPDEVLQNLSLARLKKMVMLEFDLQQADFLNIEGKEYSRNDLINLFESLGDSAVFAAHLEIFQNKALLDMLEKEQFTGEGLKHCGSLGLPAREVVMRELNPIYAKKVGEALSKFQYNNAAVYVNLAADHQLMLEKGERRIRREIQDLIERLHFSSAAETAQHGDILFLVSPGLYQFLNLLPGHFYGAIEKLLIAIIDVTHDMLNNWQNEFFVKEVYRLLFTVNAFGSIRQLIRSNAKSLGVNRHASPYYGAKRTHPRRKKREFSGASWMVGVAIIIIIRFVANINDHKPDSVPYNASVPPGIHSFSDRPDPGEARVRAQFALLHQYLTDQVYYSSGEVCDGAFEIPDVLYSEMFFMLNAKAQVDSIELVFVNDLSRDAVLFAKGGYALYNNHVAPGDSIRFPASADDMMFAYCGACWNPNHNLDFHSSLFPEPLSGAFMQTDDVSRGILGNVFVVQPLDSATVRPLRIRLYEKPGVDYGLEYTEGPLLVGSM